MPNYSRLMFWCTLPVSYYDDIFSLIPPCSTYPVVYHTVALLATYCCTIADSYTLTYITIFILRCAFPVILWSCTIPVIYPKVVIWVTYSEVALFKTRTLILYCRWSLNPDVALSHSYTDAALSHSYTDVALSHSFTDVVLSQTHTLWPDVTLCIILDSYFDVILSQSHFLMH